MTERDLHLVLGVSSAGKSTFVERQREKGVWTDLPLVMAHELGRGKSMAVLDEPCVLHYNLLRPFQKDFQAAQRNPLTDPILEEILRRSERVDAHLLVAPRSVILKRCLLRSSVEPTRRLRNLLTRYPSRGIFGILSRIDLPGLHEAWLTMLEKMKIAFDIRNSTDDSFAPVKRTEVASLLNASTSGDFTAEEIDKVIKSNKFAYHSISLPFGKRTPGENRAGTAAFLDDDLTGKSLLDVGCGYGYFCFEAEKRNAARVVGTDVNPVRFDGCTILKEILGSRVEFMERDVISMGMDEKFDVVLLLNVIHHLKEPITALRVLADICREKLVIEFPTLADPKFRATLPLGARVDSTLPLIGVSLLGREDQTFLFTDESLRRLLTEHRRLFSKVVFSNSPKSADRRIAVCYK